MFVIRFWILYVSYLGFAFFLLARHSHKTGSVSALASFVSWLSPSFSPLGIAPNKLGLPLFLNVNVLKSAFSRHGIV